MIKTSLFLFSIILMSAFVSSLQVEDIYLPEGDKISVETWIDGLEIPWSLIFMPDGRALVSERAGRVRLIQNGKIQKTPYMTIDAAHTGEAGLMGLALHPDFPAKPFIYAMHTYRKKDNLYNRVIRLIDSGNEARFDRIIMENIPGGKFHNGGRIAFGADRMLYITTGETFESDIAQDITSLGGKILRITPEGNIPDDNPFRGSPVYSYGHRNPQGLAWDPVTGKLFSSEHGPSGEFLRFGNDEINIIVKGGNYGWPEVIGSRGKKKYIDPVIVWDKATPPSGITFYKGNLLKHLRNSLFIATLRSEALIRIVFDGKSEKPKRVERWFSEESGKGRYGRIRDVVEGPDAALYFLTNNRDGRGSPKPGDDKIYRIVPKE